MFCCWINDVDDWNVVRSEFFGGYFVLLFGFSFGYDDFYVFVLFLGGFYDVYGSFVVVVSYYDVVVFDFFCVEFFDFFKGFFWIVDEFFGGVYYDEFELFKVCFVWVCYFFFVYDVMECVW